MMDSKLSEFLWTVMKEEIISKTRSLFLGCRIQKNVLQEASKMLTFDV